MKRLFKYTIITVKNSIEEKRTLVVTIDKFLAYELTQINTSIDSYNLKLIFIENHTINYFDITSAEATSIINDIAKKEQGGLLKRLVNLLW